MADPTSLDASLASHQRFQTAKPIAPAADVSETWRAVRAVPRPRAGDAPLGSPMEVGLSILAELREAPPRTLHSASIVRSSPLSTAVRAMLETREFGRRFDALEVDLGPLAASLPPLECPSGNVRFLANDRSFDELSLSVDCLLQHRKRLLAPSVARAHARRDALVLGAGPGGLMVAIQLALRDHRVVVCEAREVYTRNRFIGVYEEVAHLMAALGMPERMTYDFTHYRGKRGIMLADIQTFLHAVALKLGVIIYTGAIARNLGATTVAAGEIELQRSTRGGAEAASASSVGMTRWQHDTITRVRSGVAIRFDTIVEATGGRSGLRELLVGKDNVISIRTLGRAAAQRDPSLRSFFDDPEDHCAQFVESDYGCPPGLLPHFASVLRAGADADLPDELPCFVSNIDASVLTKPIRKTERVAGVAARVGDQDLDIPHDWVVVECPLTDRTLTRYQIEGPLPQTFEFGGKRVPTSTILGGLNPVSLLLRILYAMGVPFDAVDRRRLIEFYTVESSQGDASDIVATWVGSFRTLRLGGEQPIWCGRVPGSQTVEYGIVGEALQNAWYRFGVGVDDTFRAASRFAEGIELAPDARRAEALRLERVALSRSVQILYHLYAVSLNPEQGVVGPVLTEHYMDEQHSTDLAEARLREEARQATELLAADADLRAGAADDALLRAALEYQREACGRRVLRLLESLPYAPELLRRAAHPLRVGAADWRPRVLAALEPALSAKHRELLLPVFGGTAPAPPPDGARARTERLAELGLGRYAWASPWLRACALRALDPREPGARAALERAAAEADVLVAETAAAVLAPPHPDGGPRPRHLTIDKVEILARVSLFQAIPHEVLAGVAALLTESTLAAGERVFEQGDVGDSLYVIASGRVRVHEGDRTLRTLGHHEFFGELSLLDTEPRSASVSALEPTHLFRLAQEDFYALTAQRPEIVQAINRVLCQWIRKPPQSAPTSSPAA